MDLGAPTSLHHGSVGQLVITTSSDEHRLWCAPQEPRTLKIKYTFLHLSPCKELNCFVQIVFLLVLSYGTAALSLFAATNYRSRNAQRRPCSFIITVVWVDAIEKLDSRINRMTSSVASSIVWRIFPGADKTSSVTREFKPRRNRRSRARPLRRTCHKHSCQICKTPNLELQ